MINCNIIIAMIAIMLNWQYALALCFSCKIEASKYDFFFLIPDKTFYIFHLNLITAFYSPHFFSKKFTY